MAEIQLHNTLSGKLEPFVPQKPGEVRMYTCGPTVYDYAHIGNYRTFVFQDILRRFLKLRGFELQHVMNLTDVDDRIIANAAAAGKNIRDYTDKFVQAFFDDCKTLSIEAPEHWIRATDHIGGGSSAHAGSVIRLAGIPVSRSERTWICRRVQ